MPAITRFFAGLLVFACWACPAGAQVKLTSGIIESIDAAKKELTITTGKSSVKLTLPKEAKIRLEGSSVELSALKPGQKIYAIHDPEDPATLVLNVTQPDDGRKTVVNNTPRINVNPPVRREPARMAPPPFVPPVRQPGGRPEDLLSGIGKAWKVWNDSMKEENPEPGSLPWLLQGFGKHVAADIERRKAMRENSDPPELAGQGGNDTPPKPGKPNEKPQPGRAPPPSAKPSPAPMTTAKPKPAPPVVKVPEVKPAPPVVKVPEVKPTPVVKVPEAKPEAKPAPKPTPPVVKVPEIKPMRPEREADMLYGTIAYKDGSTDKGLNAITTDYNGQRGKHDGKGNYTLDFKAKVESKVTVYLNGSAYATITVKGPTRLDILVP